MASCTAHHKRVGEPSPYMNRNTWVKLLWGGWWHRDQWGHSGCNLSTDSCRCHSWLSPTARQSDSPDSARQRPTAPDSARQRPTVTPVATTQTVPDSARQWPTVADSAPTAPPRQCPDSAPTVPLTAPRQCPDSSPTAPRQLKGQCPDSAPTVADSEPDSADSARQSDSQGSSPRSGG